MLSKPTSESSSLWSANANSDFAHEPRRQIPGCLRRFEMAFEPAREEGEYLRFSKSPRFGADLKLVFQYDTRWPWQKESPEERPRGACNRCCSNRRLR